MTGSKVGEALLPFGAIDPACAEAAAAGRPDDIRLALDLVQAVLDDRPFSTDLLVDAAGEVLVTLRLASMVVGLLEGDTAEEKRGHLRAYSLALRMQPQHGGDSS